MPEFHLDEEVTVSRKNSFVRQNATATKTLNDGQKRLNEYTVLQQIGRGAYSKVKLSYNRSDDTYYAIKVLDRNALKKLGLGQSNGLAKAQREIAILKMLRHPNIITLHEVIDDPQSRKMYLVLELAAEGPLMNVLPDGRVQPDDFGNDRIPEAEASRIIREVIRALRYAHANGIVHRDVKPANILLTETFDVKLSDFGVSACLFDDDVNTAIVEGTLPYLPPEVLNQHLGVDLFKADVWALGITTYVMVFGRLPYLNVTTVSDLMARMLAEPVVHDKLECSPELREFLAAALNPSVEDRFDMQQLSRCRWLSTGPMSPESIRPALADVSQFQIQAAVTQVTATTLRTGTKADFDRSLGLASRLTARRVYGERRCFSPREPRSPKVALSRHHLRRPMSCSDVSDLSISSESQ